MQKELMSNSKKEESMLYVMNKYELEQKGYSGGKDDNANVGVYYITDIHLPQHGICPNIGLKSKKKKIDIIIKKMFKNNLNQLDIPFLINMDKSVEEFEWRWRLEYNRDILWFGGDISESIDDVELFFERLILRYLYLTQFKKHERLFVPAKNEKEIETEYNRYLDELNIKYNKCLKKIRKIEKKSKKRFFNSYKEKDIYTIQELLLKRKDLPAYTFKVMEQMKQIQNEIKQYVSRRQEFFEYNSVYHKYQLVKEKKSIFFVLGNHELSQFDTAQIAYAEYKKRLEPLGITVLCNECVNYFGFNIIGGVGFTQYNDQYNATTLIGPKNMMLEGRKYNTHSLEIQESQIFKNKYLEALNRAKLEKKRLLVLTHYPVEDWLGTEERDSSCVYFSGHTHRNYLSINSKEYIYADNQIGYKSVNFCLKRARLGFCKNPFMQYQDGYYEITIEKYCDFCMFSGEPIQGVTVLNKNLINAKLYMMKYCGYYGFFIISERNTKICVGGKVKNINKIKNLNDLYACFQNVLVMYIRILAPYRTLQEKIAREIKEISKMGVNTWGIEGKIHGCIIDVDYYHHIMVNPLDGKITFYYSQTWGQVQTFKNYFSLLEHINGGLPEKQKRLLLEKQKQELTTKDMLISVENINESPEVKHIQLRNSVYSYSYTIKQLQRLFDSNILREWNSQWENEAFIANGMITDEFEKMFK